MERRPSSDDLFLGVDIGSILTKAVLIDGEGNILSYAVSPSGSDYTGVFEKVRGEVLKEGMAREEIITGYGTQKLSRRKVSDLICHARGINHIFRDVRTLIEVGGQATRVMRIDERGRVLEFVVSEKCAAGSGRFLQIIAKVLHVPFDEVGELSLKSRNPVQFTTGCAVFAETEAIARIVEGAKPEDIARGVHLSIATKIKSLVERIGLSPECAITGGGAKDKGLVKAVEEKLGVSLLVPPEPLITGALGAALIGRG